ncbi:MAG: hypothetical protein KAG53_11155 [Endozoicomonadaceae bacterium]|nr:hypothetical protein [Endozoicomonadaceae bacterium]
MKNRTLGSACIIAGTSIGAGMITMPLVAAMVGFRVTVILMVLNWLLAAGSGLMVAQVCCAQSRVTTLFGAVSQQLGRPGKVVATLATIFLPYALSAAYIAGAAELLTKALHYWLGLSLSVYGTAVIVTLLFAAVIQTGTRCVDLVNRLLFFIQLMVLMLLIIWLLPSVHWAQLDSPISSSSYWVAGLPLFFTSFGFQASVPSIVRYLEGDLKRIRLAILWGASLPLLIYLLWTVATNGVIANESLMLVSREREAISALVFAIGKSVDSGWVTMLITFFAGLALTTSFLGVSLGLFDYMAEAMAHADSVKGRCRTTVITFLPPLMVVLLVPDVFIAALGFAAVALVVLALLLPGLMLMKLYGRAFRPWQHILLALAVTVGLMIVVAQLLVVVGAVPSLS